MSHNISKFLKVSYINKVIYIKLIIIEINFINKFIKIINLIIFHNFYKEINLYLLYVNNIKDSFLKYIKYYFYNSFKKAFIEKTVIYIINNAIIIL